MMNIVKLCYLCVSVCVCLWWAGVGWANELIITFDRKLPPRSRTRVKKTTPVFNDFVDFMETSHRERNDRKVFRNWFKKWSLLINSYPRTVDVSTMLQRNFPGVLKCKRLFVNIRPTMAGDHTPTVFSFCFIKINFLFGITFPAVDNNWQVPAIKWELLRFNLVLLGNWK